ncbi:MAG: hypothetical protein ACREA0_05665, partial [bacterium]
LAESVILEDFLEDARHPLPHLSCVKAVARYHDYRLAHPQTRAHIHCRRKLALPVPQIDQRSPRDSQLHHPRRLRSGARGGPPQNPHSATDFY